MKFSILLYFVSFIILFFPLFTFIIMWNITHPQKILSKNTPKVLGWEYEDITLTTKDNINLSAWFVPSTNKSDKAIILLHGYPADKGDLIYWSRFLKDEYNLLFFDFRYFGKSRGSHTTLGQKEKNDIISAVDFLKKRGFQKIGLMGFSFGGSVALLTLPEISEDVSVVIADSPYANLDLMGKAYYQNFSFLNRALTQSTKFWGKLIYKINANELAPEKAVLNSKTPILIIHSFQDELVVVENAKRIEKALKNNKNAEVLILNKGSHTQVGRKDEEELITYFLKKHLL